MLNKNRRKKAGLWLLIGTLLLLLSPASLQAALTLQIALKDTKANLLGKTGFEWLRFFSYPLEFHL